MDAGSFPIEIFRPEYRVKSHGGINAVLNGLKRHVSSDL